MPTEQDTNKAVAHRFLDLIADHDVDSLVAVITPTWTMEGGPPGLPAGEAGIRALFDSFGRIQQKWTVDDLTLILQPISVEPRRFDRFVD